MALMLEKCKVDPTLEQGPRSWLRDVGQPGGFPHFWFMPQNVAPKRGAKTWWLPAMRFLETERQTMPSCFGFFRNTSRPSSAMSLQILGISCQLWAFGELNHLSIAQESFLKGSLKDTLCPFETWLGSPKYRETTIRQGLVRVYHVKIPGLFWSVTSVSAWPEESVFRLEGAANPPPGPD